MVFHFKCYNLPFFGWWDGNVDKYSVSCNHILLCQYVQNYRPLPHPHIYNLFKVAKYLSIMWQRLLIIPNVHELMNTVQKQEIMNINNQDTEGSTLAVFRYPEHPRFSDGIPDSPE